MNVDNVKSQMRKGMLEYCILLLLHRESAYSSDIIQKPERGPADCGGRHALPVADPPEERRTPVVRVGGVHAGPPRKYYGLTPEGEEFLKELESAWDGLSDTVNHLRQNI